MNDDETGGPVSLDLEGLQRLADEAALPWAVSDVYGSAVLVRDASGHLVETVYTGKGYMIANLASAVPDLLALVRRQAEKIQALDDLAADLAAISRTVTASYPDGMVDELVFRRRVGKVGVEFGELQDAIEGWTGENPRKGQYASREDVVKELIDCASAALCAVEYMTGDEGQALSMLAEQITGNHRRLAAALDSGVTP